jgi:hypothetical protein
MPGCLEVICAIVANPWLYAKCCLVHCVEGNHILVLVPFFTLIGPQVSVLVPVQAGFANSLIRRSRSTIWIRVSQIPKHPVWVSSKEWFCATSQIDVQITWLQNIHNNTYFKAIKKSLGLIMFEYVIVLEVSFGCFVALSPNGPLYNVTYWV